MKAEIINQHGLAFQTIEIKFTIESQAELDALVLARKDLWDSEIDDTYDSATRYYWVKALETLAEGL